MNPILVPLDGSRLSEAIIPMAEALARDYEVGLLLVRALHPQGSLDAEVATQKEAEGYLATVAGDLEARGLTDVRWKVWYDHPDRAIVDAARHNGATLIAMTTHGRGGLGRVLLGSVADSVVRRSPVPVLLVRGELSWTPGAIGRIVVPLDGSERSEAVLPVVERLAGPFDFTIDLLQAVEPLAPTAAAELSMESSDHIMGLRLADADAYLTKVAAALEAKGLRVRPEVRLGPAAEVILEYARRERPGLVAMSTHGRSGLNRLLLGSVAEHVLRGAPVPLLLWKAAAAHATAR